jgi:hypothetical protein
MKIIALLSLCVSLAACSKGKQAPKPVEWKSGAVTQQQARKVLDDAERRQPCSEQNLKDATEEQKKRCDPTQGMFDHVGPVAPPATNKKRKP